MLQAFDEKTIYSKRVKQMGIEIKGQNLKVFF